MAKLFKKTTRTSVNCPAPLQPGLPYPLGATWTSRGINFALVAPHARLIELCLFDGHGVIELQRLVLPTYDDGVWCGMLAFENLACDVLVYGYRAYGEHAPEKGHRFNPAKVLLDPYARTIVGTYLGQDAFQDENPTDTAAIALKAKISVAPEQLYHWHDDTPPRIAREHTVLYELHVHGFTRLHPDVPEALQGSYAALAYPAMLDYLTSLGITTVSLLPVHYRADEARLQDAGLSNYWGYSSIGFFAPDPRYWSARPGTTAISEFRDMVQALHRRGIEVVLDVVYNHTAELDADGPTLSFRGIDNALYYHLRPDDPTVYENWTGCGNTLKISEPRVLQLVMDSLRYWVQEMHVDGFRFDLAPVLGRDARGFSGQAAFFAALLQDPVLAGVKLIAEPWDIGPGGYQLGNFPSGWQEWNDRYRDTMRAFWLQRSVPLGDFAHCLMASNKHFDHTGRLPAASVNFITAHDGFTVRDLVQYDRRHNEANGEDNRDGHSHNLSTNCGVEGPTDDAGILALRGKLQRALLATLFLSQGTPMLLAGDEFGNSQGGNNNAYCQNNATGWLEWREQDTAHHGFVRRLIALRRRHAALRHPIWHTDAAPVLKPEPWPAPDNAATDDEAITLNWRLASGEVLNKDDWQGHNRLALYFKSSWSGNSIILLFNADTVACDFSLPEGRWEFVLDSSIETGQPVLQSATASTTVAAHSVVVMV